MISPVFCQTLGVTIWIFIVDGLSVTTSTALEKSTKFPRIDNKQQNAKGRTIGLWLDSIRLALDFFYALIKTDEVSYIYGEKMRINHVFLWSNEIESNSWPYVRYTSNQNFQTPMVKGGLEPVLIFLLDIRCWTMIRNGLKRRFCPLSISACEILKLTSFSD